MNTNLCYCSHMRFLKWFDKWFTHHIPWHWMTRIALWSAVYLLLVGYYFYKLHQYGQSLVK
jgi:hypothetical protein